MIIRTLVFATLLFPGAALALEAPDLDEVPREFFVRVGSVWVQDPSLDLVSDNDALPRTEFGFAISPAPSWAVELSYGLVGASATSFEVVESNLWLHQFQLAAVHYLPLWSHFRARARAGGAFELAHLRLEPGGGPSYSDTAALLALEATLGVEWILPLFTQGLLFGTTVDAGYGYRPILASFDELERTDGETSGRIRQLPVDVGELDLSGWVLRFGVSMHF